MKIDLNEHEAAVLEEILLDHQQDLRLNKIAWKRKIPDLTDRMQHGMMVRQIQEKIKPKGL